MHMKNYFTLENVIFLFISYGYSVFIFNYIIIVSLSFSEKPIYKAKTYFRRTKYTSKTFGLYIIPTSMDLIPLACFLIHLSLYAFTNLTMILHNKYICLYVWDTGKDPPQCAHIWVYCTCYFWKLNLRFSWLYIIPNGVNSIIMLNRILL